MKSFTCTQTDQFNGDDIDPSQSNLVYFDPSLFPETQEFDKKYNKRLFTQKKGTKNNIRKIIKNEKNSASCVRCGRKFLDFEHLSSHMKFSLNCRAKENDYFLSELGISTSKDTKLQPKPKINIPFSLE